MVLQRIILLPVLILFNFQIWIMEGDKSRPQRAAITDKKRARRDAILGAAHPIWNSCADDR